MNSIITIKAKCHANNYYGNMEVFRVKHELTIPRSCRELSLCLCFIKRFMLYFAQKSFMGGGLHCNYRVCSRSRTLRNARQGNLRHGFIHYGLIIVHERQDLEFGVINHYVCDKMNVCYPRNRISLTSQIEDCRT